MNGQIWDEEEAETPQKNALPYIPIPGEQSIGSSFQWDFTPNSSEPAWPQTYLDTPISTASNRLLTPPTDAFWNPFDVSFGEPVIWDQWDRGQNDASGRNTLENVDEQQVALASVTSNNCQQETLIIDSITHEPHPRTGEFPAGSSNRISGCVGKTPATSTRSTSMMESGGMAKARQGSSISTESVEFSQSRQWPSHQSLSTDISNVPMVRFLAGSAPQTTQDCKPPDERGSMFSPPIPQILHRQRLKGRRRSTSRSSSVESSTLADSKNHNKTEKKYRSRLNVGFSTLLKALPEELVSSSGGSGAQGEKAISKVETLDLALSYIRVLEIEQKQLKQESLVLKGQVVLFERVFSSQRCLNNVM